MKGKVEEGEGDLFWTHRYHYNNYCYWWKENCVVFPSPAKNRNPICRSHFHPFLSSSLHYHYRGYDWSRRFYLNCPQHHHNTLELMTTSRRKKKKGGLVNSGMNNAAMKEKQSEPRIWLEMFWRHRREDRNQKLF